MSEKDWRPLSKRTDQELEGEYKALTPQQGSSHFTPQSAFHHLHLLNQSKIGGPRFRMGYDLYCFPPLHPIKLNWSTGSGSHSDKELDKAWRGLRTLLLSGIN